MDNRKSRLCIIDFFIMLGVYCLALMILPASSSIVYNGSFAWETIAIRFVFLAVMIFASRFAFRVYNHIWRYASGKIYLFFVIADMVGGGIAILLGRVVPFLNLGFGITLTVVSLCCLASITARFCYQLVYARRNMALFDDGNLDHKVNVAIVGAGNIGATLAEELSRNPQAHYKVICFIDVDRSKIGQRLNGVPVYPEDDKIIERVKEMPVQEIVIALPDLDGEGRAKLYKLYKQTGCPIKLYDYPFEDEKQDKPQMKMRELRIEDLLARKSIHIDNTVSKAYYKDKVVLVTGGGGSIGSELCRQIAKFKPAKLIIFDIYENNAYDIQQELLSIYGEELQLDVVIGSVRDTARLEEIFSQNRPQMVVHAAAHKHVPLMEHSSAEAIKNNVMGTYNTANMAEKYGAEKFVLISTDKAVNPTNIMGASKRLCEMIIQCRRDSSTKFVAVRFGNVLGSNGSVIPLFKKQIEAGGPVTVTDKNIIRYFMTIPEAAQLVLVAGAMAHRGELYVLNMGKPVKIYDLAENMIRLLGHTPGEDIKIEEIGLRPGEKLYEELLMDNEKLDKTDNDKIFIEKDKPFSREEIEEKLRLLADAAADGSYEAVKSAIRETVPTYREPEVANCDSEKEKAVRAAVGR